MGYERYTIYHNGAVEDSLELDLLLVNKHAVKKCLSINEIIATLKLKVKYFNTVVINSTLEQKRKKQEEAYYVTNDQVDKLGKFYDKNILEMQSWRDKIYHNIIGYHGYMKLVMTVVED